MKKLFFTLLLAAAVLPGWADDFYIVGNATSDGWTDNARTDAYKMTSPSTNKYTWTGFLKQSGDNDGFKICTGSTTWAAWCASSNGKDLAIGDTNDTPISYSGSGTTNDNKWDVVQTGYYQIDLDLSGQTKSFTAKILIKAENDGTCLIENATDLTEFRKLVNDKGMTSLNAELTADITLTGNHTPIGTSTNKYAGTFDGKGNVIKNLSLSATSGSGVGFFGYTNGATIQDVEFLKANVNVTGGNNTGIVVGICDGRTTIQRCAVVNSYLKGSDHTGSIAGCAKGNSIIQNCYSNAKVVSGSQAAGMVGTSEGMTIEHCLFMGPRIESSGGYGARGLISLLEGSNDNQTYMKNNLVAAQYVLSNGKRHGVLTYIDNGTLHSENNYSLSTTLYGPASNPATESHTNKDDINGAQVAPNNVNQTFFSTTLGFDLTDTWKMVEDLTYAGGSYPILKWMTAPETSVGISSAEDLFDFCTFLWDNQDATLSSDVTYSATVYQGQDAMIGTGPNPYKGTFDGQNHTITVGFNNTNAEYTGLFCQVNGGTIKNLKVAGNITTDKKFAGGICANVNRKATITNCESNVTITDSRTTEVDGTHGGIVALISSHGDGVEISNCLFSGAISASTVDGCGGVVGWTSGGSSNVTIKNCLITGKMTVRTTGANDIIARNGAKESDNYYVGSFSGISNAESATSATDTQKTSGELCYLLNGRTQGGTNWTQTIGTDNYPVPFNTQKLVYFNDPGYANMHIVDNVYQIANANELVDFSALVNSGSTSINAELTADIDMTGITSWTPIGKFEKPSGKNDDYNDGSKAYNGTFDGKGHTIDNLVQDVTAYNNQGLFGVVNGGCTIKNLILGSGCKFYGGKYVGAFVGSSRGSGWVTIENCGNEANVGSDEHRPSQNAAAFIGVVVGGGPATKILNCYNTGTIKGSSSNDNAILTGWFGGHGSVEVKNFYNIGSVEGYESGKPLYRNGDTGITFTNNYSTTSDQGATQIVDSWKASGELCYKLKGTQETNAFTQAIGTDAYPIFGSATVDRGQWFGDDYIYYNIDESGNITVNELNLDDTKTVYNVPAKVTAKSVTLTRTLHALTADGTQSRWNTFCSPVDIAKSNFSAAKELTGVTANGDNYSMTFTDAEGDVLEAGKPYMVQVSENKSSLTASNVAVAAAGTSTSSETINGLTFTGNFTNGNAPLGSFIISNNVFYLVDTDTNTDGISEVALKAFRGYITTAGNNVKALTFDFDDDATGISLMEDGRSQMEDGAIYNVAGQRINKMQRGINIVNGKKILK